MTVKSLWDFPQRPGDIATRDQVVGNVVKAAVLLADPLARTSASLWRRSERLANRLIDNLDPAHHADLRSAIRSLRDAPRNVQCQRRLASAVDQQLGDASQWPAGLAEASEEFTKRNRIDMWVGHDYRNTGLPRGWEPPPGRHASLNRLSCGCCDVCVVVDFRDTDGEPGRVRNLTAALLCLNDQSLDRSRYRIVCVEAADEPHHRATMSRLCDRYIHAPSRGPYNRSWAHNVGAIHGADGNDRYLCFLDADILLERRHLQQFLAVMDAGGLSAYLPHRNLLYLDEASSVLSLQQRFSSGDGGPNFQRLFGYRIPSKGGCILVRTEVFHLVRGFDERYCGWGDEDNDFVRRLSARTTLSIGAESLLHLNHGRPSMEAAGRRANEWLIGRQDWHEEHIGNLGKYRDRAEPRRYRRPSVPAHGRKAP